MNQSELEKKIDELLPEADIENCDDGQIVIYTGVLEIDSVCASKLCELFPTCEFEMDEDRQVLIYTNMCINDDGELFEGSLY